MHLLYIHQHFTTPSGKGGIRSYQMARNLVERGHRVTMVCGTFAGGDTGATGAFEKGVRRGHVDGIDVVEVDLAYSNRLNFIARTKLFFRFAFTATRIALLARYDVVFATTTPLTVAIPGILARWIRRKPFVFEVRDLWPELPRAMGVITNPIVLGAMSVLEWLAYRSANRLIGLAPGIVDGIRRRGVPAERITSVPNGCDIDIFAGAEAIPIPGVAPGETVAIFTGTHGLANGLDSLVDGAEALARHGRTDIKLVLVGDGQQKAALASRVARLGLDNILFLPPVSKATLAGYLRSSDVGLQCLRNVEAFYNGTSPNKFFDYLAAGLPVLINYPGWIAELVKNSDCGKVAAPDDAEAFAGTLIALADDPEGRAAMGANALALARREFDRGLLAERWVGVVEGAASVLIRRGGSDVARSQRTSSVPPPSRP